MSEMFREPEYQLPTGDDRRCKMFVVKSGNQWLAESSQKQDPVSLWRGIFIEGENCILYADSGVGKSVLAVQIGVEIAKTRIVLYCDFELTEKQFEKRYRDDDTKALFEFPENFLRAEIDPQSINPDAFEAEVINGIKEMALEYSATVIIIDNLSWICNEAEKGDAAGRLMQALMNIRREMGWSLLVLAHTPKRNLSTPIDQNNLAGSKKIMNFTDAAFSIGFSAKDSGLRYIKQTKHRSGEMIYHADNVEVCSLEKVGSFLQFVHRGFATEREHLQVMEDKERLALIDAVKALRSEGKTIRQIASELNISRAMAGRLSKR